MSSAEALYSTARHAAAIISPALGPANGVSARRPSNQAGGGDRGWWVRIGGLGRGVGVDVTRRFGLGLGLTDDVNAENLVGVLLNELSAG
jgi:hypothetical protein